MSTEEKLGRLLAYAEHADERLDRIEGQLGSFVSKREFDSKVSEHAVLQSQITELKETQDRGKWLTDIGSKAVLVITTIVIGAVAAAIGLK